MTNLSDSSDRNGNTLAGVDVGTVHLQRHGVQGDAVHTAKEEEMKTNG